MWKFNRQILLLVGLSSISTVFGCGMLVEGNKSWADSTDSLEVTLPKTDVALGNSPVNTQNSFSNRFRFNRSPAG